ncbi:MAG TPA: sigma-70 family RNA polymerase sigma factor [Acidimicrobiales bacterium]
MSTDAAGHALYPMMPGFDEVAADVLRVAHRVARAIVHDPQDALDISQETAARALAAWPAMATHPEPWAATVAHNLAIGVLRRRTRDDRPLPTGSPTDVDGTTITRADLAKALEQLPERQRQVLLLRYWADMSERQIADALGCTPGTVKTHTSRALARLAKGARAALAGYAQPDREEGLEPTMPSQEGRPTASSTPPATVDDSVAAALLDVYEADVMGPPDVSPADASELADLFARYANAATVKPPDALLRALLRRVIDRCPRPRTEPRRRLDWIEQGNLCALVALQKRPGAERTFDDVLAELEHALAKLSEVGARS